MNPVKFSIIMPAYNAGKTIGEAVQSVLLQTFVDFELLIVDDASTDETTSLIEKIQLEDSRIFLLRSTVNQGVAKARNQAINIARGRFIAFLDADDIWLPRKLALQYEAFLSGASVVCSSYIRFHPNGTEVLVRTPSNLSYKNLLYGNPIGNLTAAYDSHVLGKRYQRAYGHEDYIMWLEIFSSATNVICITEPLARYRVGSSSLSHNKFIALGWTWDIYRRQLRFGRIAALYLMIRYVVSAIIKRV